MTLHPQVRAALAARPRPAGQDIDADPLGALATARSAMLAAVPAECGPPVPVARVSDVDADGVPCRLYVPAPGVPVLVYAHGGGWAMGSTDIVDAFCRRIADRSGCAVLSVGYRLAPEHPYPAAVDDVETALGWLRRTGQDLDVSRVAIGGDSAGGHLAAVVARRQRDAGRPLSYQVLIYPVIDPAMSSQSYRQLGEHGLDRATMARFWDLFVPDPADRGTPDVAPLTAPLAGLPPTLLITAEYDVLRDEGERYGVELLAAGVPVVTVRYQGVNHGFVRKLALFDAAGPATDQIAMALRTTLL